MKIELIRKEPTPPPLEKVVVELTPDEARVLHDLLVAVPWVRNVPTASYSPEGRGIQELFRTLDTLHNQGHLP